MFKASLFTRGARLLTISKRKEAARAARPRAQLHNPGKPATASSPRKRHAPHTGQRRVFQVFLRKLSSVRKLCARGGGGELPCPLPPDKRAGTLALAFAIAAISTRFRLASAALAQLAQVLGRLPSRRQKFHQRPSLWSCPKHGARCIALSSGEGWGVEHDIAGHSARQIPEARREAAWRPRR